MSLIVSLLAAMLGIVGLNLFKDAGPRERMKAENGSRIIVEELSFYRHGDKVFGKIFKPTDENGFSRTPSGRGLSSSSSTNR